MNIEFVVGGLLVWVVLALVLIIANVPLKDGSGNEMFQPWGVVVRDSFLWPVALVSTLYGVVHYYVSEYWAAFQMARGKHVEEVFHETAEPCLSIRERCLIAYRYYDLTPPEIGRVLMNDITLTADHVFAARKRLDSANVPLFGRQLSMEQNQFLAYCG